MVNKSNIKIKMCVLGKVGPVLTVPLEMVGSNGLDVGYF
jgi:hypothetical protein